MAGLTGLPTHGPDYGPDWPLGNTVPIGHRKIPMGCAGNWTWIGLGRSAGLHSREWSDGFIMGTKQL